MSPSFLSAHGLKSHETKLERMSSVDREASRKTISSSICVYKEVKVNLHYRHSLRVVKKKKKRPEARTVSMQTNTMQVPSEEREGAFGAATFFGNDRCVPSCTPSTVGVLLSVVHFKHKPHV